MTNYEYIRGHIADGIYDIENPLRVDGEGNQIYLAKEIEVAIPGLIFKTNCDHELCTIITERDLTVDEKATLDTVVSNHKNNV